ncbi:uncharacterized protein VTP21DRAFT_10224 [Calcarisporiella thermophila]|uniref:uncharacterized protein n=1 Tax=Calcarisporiella thermophila TaxID=911321 RepID=UPI003742EC00
MARIFIFFLFALIGGALAEDKQGENIQVVEDQILIPVSGGAFSMSASNLSIKTTDQGQEIIVSAPAVEDLGKAGPITVRGREAQWSFPSKNWTIRATSEDGRLVINVQGTHDTLLTWPTTGVDQNTSTMQIPRGSGLSIPVRDPFWNSNYEQGGLNSTDTFDLTGGGGFEMPFWGYTIGSRGVSYIVPTDIGTKGRTVSDGQLRLVLSHEFSDRAETLNYTVMFALTDDSPLAAGLDYRRYLISQNALYKLQQKIEANPEVGKLIGAFHAYLWNQSRTDEGIAKIRQTGISRMWVGYDASPELMNSKAVTVAQEAGYLVGPYDSWANAQDPAKSDTTASIWPGTVYPDGCIIKFDGKIREGFKKRGCYLSSQALAQDEPTKHYIAERIKNVTANGAKSVFLDVDAAGELWDDFSPKHRMNQLQDRQNRIERMRKLSKNFVVGSETVHGWASEVVAFSHGSATVVAGAFWKKQGEIWGKYYPPAGPDFFFKPVTLPEFLRKAMFDPVYRVPLYEAVLHDSVINLDRWEIPLYKLNDLVTTRVLLAMLYNSPVMLALNYGELDAHGAQIAELQKYFEPLHSAAATQPLTSFRYATSDKLVQETVFGDNELKVTANFGKEIHQGLPGGCVEAVLKTDNEPRRICPAA